LKPDRTQNAQNLL